MKIYLLPVFYFLMYVCTSPVMAGLTHGDWLQGDMPNALTVVMHPAEGVAVRSFRSLDVSDAKRMADVPEADWEIPLRPDAGWFGELDIELPEGADLAYPLSIELSLTTIDKKDLLPASTNEVREIFWDADMNLVSDKAPVRYRPRVRTWTVPEHPASEHYILPLVEAPMDSNSGWGGGAMFSMLCEIKDAQGQVLYRGRPIEVFAENRNSRPTAWNLEEAEQSGTLSDPGGYNEVVKRGALPPTWAAWNEIDAVWVNAEMAEQFTTDAARLRRLLLMGVWVHADEEPLGELATALDVKLPTRVLLGGLSDLSEGGWSASAIRQHYGNSSRSFWDSSPDLSMDEEPYLANRYRLFAPLRPWFMAWTLGLLGAFLLAVLIALPTVFVLFKGQRRLLLWIWVPAVCGAFTLTICLGLFVLPRETRVDVTEYRLAVAGWPECYVQSVGRALVWGERSITWSAPGESFRIWDGAGGEDAARKDRAEQSPKGQLWTQDRIRPGTLTKIETATFMEAELPVQVEDGIITATAALDAVAIWSEGCWHIAGPMEPGQQAELAELPTKLRLAGLPGRLRNILPQTHSHSCSTGVCRSSEKETHSYDPYEGDMLVLAQMKEGSPVLQVDSPADSTHKSVIWMIQIQEHQEGGEHE